MKDKQQIAKLVVWASHASVAVAAFLLVLKLYAWLITGSVGILAALLDSLIDLFASLINLFAVRWALVPPDDEHRFGHGKAESLAGLGQAIFIVSSSLFLILASVERLLHPQLIESAQTGGMIVLLSLLITSVLLAFQRYVVKATGSVAIKADSVHYASDVLGYVAIAGGLILHDAGWFHVDPIVGLLIGAFILKSAASIAYESVQALMDHELPDDEQKKVLEIARAGEGVIEVHDLRTRQSGRTRFIQLHLVFDGHLPLSEAHHLSEQVERKLRSAFRDTDVIIHQDPHTEAKFGKA